MNVTLRSLQTRVSNGMRAAVRMTIGNFYIQTSPEEEEEKKYTYNKSVLVDREYFRGVSHVQFSVFYF